MHVANSLALDLGRRARVSIAGLRRTLLDTIFPPRCLACTEATETPQGLCAACWRDTAFIAGTACVKCGVPMPGEAGSEDICDSCLRHPPAWDAGAAAMLYSGAGRRMVLQFKHGDRLDMAPRLAGWLASAGAAQLQRADVVAPVPLHWRRLMHRRYNQSAELARRLGKRAGRPVIPDLLVRQRMTTPQEGMTRADRAANQEGAFAVAPRHRARIAGRCVLVIDDVLTSGATLSNCAEALRAGGAARVEVLVLARVAFGDSLHI